MSYLADVGTLAAKDLRLELRSRDTVPAMLLFVVATLVVFNFALPAGASAFARSRCCDISRRNSSSSTRRPCSPAISRVRSIGNP